MQFRDMIYMDLHQSSRSHPSQMTSLRSQFMETEAFHDLMEQSVLDRSGDGGGDSGENSQGVSERRSELLEGMRMFSRIPDYSCEDSLHDQDSPDSASHPVSHRKIKKKSHQVRTVTPNILCVIIISPIKVPYGIYLPLNIV